jgi:hypothetical protein
VGFFVQSEMNVLQISQADSDKQEQNFPWLLWSEFRKLLPSEIRETNQVMRFPLDLYFMDTRLFTASLQEKVLRLRQRLSDENIERID